MQEYQLEENEERSMIEPKSFENPKLKELIRVLMDWINDELHMERIIVQVRYEFQHLIINVHITPASLNNLYDEFHLGHRRGFV